MIRVRVVGAGATGGFFGGRLAQAGRDVTFLVRSKRAERLRERGLEIRSPYGNVTLAPNVVKKDRVGGPYNVVLLGSKSSRLQMRSTILRPVGETTAIPPTLSGMYHLDLLGARSATAHVLDCSIAMARSCAARGRRTLRIVLSGPPRRDVGTGRHNCVIQPIVQSYDARTLGSKCRSCVNPIGN